MLCSGIVNPLCLACVKMARDTALNGWNHWLTWLNSFQFLWLCLVCQQFSHYTVTCHKYDGHDLWMQLASYGFRSVVHTCLQPFCNMYVQTIMWKIKEPALVLSFLRSSCFAVRSVLYTVLFILYGLETDGGCCCWGHLTPRTLSPPVLKYTLLYHSLSCLI